MDKLHCKFASAVFAITGLWGGSAVHAQDVGAEQAVRKADASEAARAGESQLLGTWKLQSWVYEVIGTGALSKPFGEHPIGYLNYSPDGCMYAILVAEDRPKPPIWFQRTRRK
jgi:hypothetical protein